MLTKEKLQKYKENLEKEREKLLKEIKADRRGLDFGSDVDSDEETDEAEELGNELAIEGVIKKRISHIEAALEKIRKRTYGTCEKCGGEISEKVLDLAPESILCEKCKKK